MDLFSNYSYKYDNRIDDQNFQPLKRALDVKFVQISDARDGIVTLAGNISLQSGEHLLRQAEDIMDRFLEEMKKLTRSTLRSYSNSTDSDNTSIEDDSEDHDDSDREVTEVTLHLYCNL